MSDDVQLLEEIIEVVRGRLTGADVPRILDSEPARRFSVGVLNANRPADENAGNFLRRPESIGFFLRLNKQRSAEEARCEVRLSIYGRMIPTHEEQLGTLESSASDDDSVMLRPAYRRIDRVVEGMIEIPASVAERTTLDCRSLDERLQEVLATARAEIVGDPMAYPSATFKLTGRALRSADDYSAVIATATRDDVPHWDVRFRAQIVPFATHDRLLILVTNHSDPNQFKSAWHPPEVFGVNLRFVMEAGVFAGQPFNAVKNDYRYQTMTFGKGVNAVLEVDNQDGMAWTEHLPIFRQPRIQSRSGLEEATAAAALGDDRSIGSLERVLAWLQEYAERWRAAVAVDRSPTELRQRKQADLDAYQREVDRVAYGLQLLRENPALLHAFRLMNQSFGAAGLKSWRLFQVAFVASMLPSLYAREHPEDVKAKAFHDEVDLLWFPTGGGKTEAFLGVVIAALFYDRLRGKARGVSAWIRYPLRMLSVQQLQRLINVVAQAEEIRKAVPDAAGDGFTVGYYVGEANAPTFLTMGGGQGKQEQPIQRLERESNDDPGGLVRYRVLSRCPYCASTEVRVTVDVEDVRIRHECGACGCVAPLYVSDAEIYRYLPSVLVGTVDRLARAGQTDLVSMIFAGPREYCERHGYAAFGECIERAVCKAGRLKKLPEPTRDPSPMLLLQDEVHLLRESLGTYDAHYEGLVDVLARSLGAGWAPKRMAATATIEGFERHMYHLYVRRARSFPAPGMELTDSAYIEAATNGEPSRLYVGVLPSGRDADDVARAIAERLADEARRRAEEGRDRPNHVLLLVYVNEKNTASDIRSDWPDAVTVQVLTGDKTLEEVRSTIDRVEQDGKRPFEERLHGIIATSVVSHGVDLERLNQLIVVGMPRSFAEYIQSSSRSGRTYPGVVFTVFRWRSQRDVSMYEHFAETHERLYQFVQPVPVNHISAPALERTATGLIASVVYNLFGPRAWAERRERYIAARAVMKANHQGTLPWEDVADAVAEAYFGGFDMEPKYRQQLEDRLRRIVRRQFEDLPAKDAWSFHRRLDPEPVSSLREVGEQIEFGVSPRDLGTLKLLQRGR